MVGNKYKKFFNPVNLNDTYEVNNYSRDELISLYKCAQLIRMTELKIANQRRLGKIAGPVHLSIGQEGIPVGLSKNLNNQDYIFGAHRSHAHILSLGSSVEKLFAELLGRESGLSKGYGGSMHLIDQSVGFMGSVPIVAGTISLAIGAGFAIKQKRKGNVALVYLGDGASEEGCFHECLNLAKINNLPVIFVIENNQFSSHMDISLRQPNPLISRFSEANLIPSKVVDGNNIIEVLESSKTLIENSRMNKGPGLIEAITYRWLGHVDWREDIDVGINRCKETIDKWKAKCPIKRIRNSIINSKLVSIETLSELDSKIKSQIDSSWEKAFNSNLKTEDSLLDNVYDQ